MFNEIFQDGQEDEQEQKTPRHTENCIAETALLWVCRGFLGSGGISYITRAPDSLVHSQLRVTPPSGLSEAAAFYALCLGSVGRPSPASIRRADPKQDLKGQWFSGAGTLSTVLLICMRDALCLGWEGPVYLSSMFTPSPRNQELQVLILDGGSSMPGSPANHLSWESLSSEADTLAHSKGVSGRGES